MLQNIEPLPAQTWDGWEQSTTQLRIARSRLQLKVETLSHPSYRSTPHEEAQYRLWLLDMLCDLELDPTPVWASMVQSHGDPFATTEEK